MKNKEKVYEQPASLVRRILAFVIDLLIIDFIIIWPFRKVITRLMPVKDTAFYQALQNMQQLSNSIVFIMVVIAVLAILYFTILEMKLGQSVGKLIMKIYVKSEKEKLGFFQSLIRNMFLIPVFPFVLLWIIDPLFLIIKKKRLSEILSKTTVVERYDLSLVHK